MGTVSSFDSLRKTSYPPSIVVDYDLLETASRFEAESPVGCNDHGFAGGGIDPAPIGTVMDFEGPEVLDLHRPPRSENRLDRSEDGFDDLRRFVLRQTPMSFVNDTNEVCLCQSGSTGSPSRHDFDSPGFMNGPPKYRRRYDRSQSPSLQCKPSLLPYSLAFRCRTTRRTGIPRRSSASRKRLAK